MGEFIRSGVYWANEIIYDVRQKNKLTGELCWKDLKCVRVWPLWWGIMPNYESLYMPYEAVLPLFGEHKEHQKCVTSLS